MQSHSPFPIGDVGSLDLIVVQPETGRLVGARRSLRYEEFFSDLNAAIRRQANQKFSQTDYDNGLFEFGSSYDLSKGNSWADANGHIVLVEGNSYTLN